MKYIKANSISYGGKRSRNDIRYIIIHYTGVNGDTAENEGNAFKNWNRREAGAHFFVDQNGNIVKSIAMNLIAWSVGGAKNKYSSGGSMHGIITNANSVSIELCDNLKRDPSKEQIEAVKKCIKYIRRFCPNAKSVYRHYDVTGKACPARMVSKEKWIDFKKAIGE